MKTKLMADARDLLCEVIAWVIYGLSKMHLAPRPRYSTCIGEWTTCGYVLDSNGFFCFPLLKLARDFDAECDAISKSLQENGCVAMPHTVLLLRPDYAAATFGHDTFCAHVEGTTVEEALTAARTAACEADEGDAPEDYHCLFCTDGHVVDYSDGAGGACAPRDQTRISSETK